MLQPCFESSLFLENKSQPFLSLYTVSSFCAVLLVIIFLPGVSVNRGNAKGTNSSDVLCLMLVYVCFVLCEFV